MALFFVFLFSQTRGFYSVAFYSQVQCWFFPIYDTPSTPPFKILFKYTFCWFVDYTIISWMQRKLISENFNTRLFCDDIYNSLNYPRVHNYKCPLLEETLFPFNIFESTLSVGRSEFDLVYSISSARV